MQNHAGTKNMCEKTGETSAGQKKPREGREAAAPSNIKEIQERQGGQEAPHDGDAFNLKDA
jgi:hypothetical protein